MAKLWQLLVGIDEPLPPGPEIDTSKLHPFGLDNPVYNRDHPAYYKYGTQAGGLLMTFGMFVDKPLHEIPFVYLMSQFQQRDGPNYTRFLRCFTRFVHGAVTWIADHPGEYRIAFGLKHPGKKLSDPQCASDSSWMHWCLGRAQEYPYWGEQHVLFVIAAHAWLRMEIDANKYPYAAPSNWERVEGFSRQEDYEEDMIQDAHLQHLEEQEAAKKQFEADRERREEQQRLEAEQEWLEEQAYARSLVEDKPHNVPDLGRGSRTTGQAVSSASPSTPKRKRTTCSVSFTTPQRSPQSPQTPSSTESNRTLVGSASSSPSKKRKIAQQPLESPLSGKRKRKAVKEEEEDEFPSLASPTKRMRKLRVNSE